MRTCVTAWPSSRLFTSGFTIFSRHSTSSAARPPAGGPPVSSPLRPRLEARGRGREKGGALRNVNGDCRALRFGSLRAREQSANAVDGGTEPCAVGHVEDRDGTVPRLGHASLQEAHRADGLGCLSSHDRARKSEKSRGRKFVPHHPLPFFSVKTTGMRMRTVRPGLPQREAARATAVQAGRLAPRSAIPTAQPPMTKATLTASPTALAFTAPG